MKTEQVKSGLGWAARFLELTQVTLIRSKYKGFVLKWHSGVMMWPYKSKIEDVYYKVEISMEKPKKMGSGGGGENFLIFKHGFWGLIPLKTEIWFNKRGSIQQ